MPVRVVPAPDSEEDRKADDIDHQNCQCRRRYQVHDYAP